MNRSAFDIRLEQVVHEYGETEESSAVRALDGVDLFIRSGDFVVMMGPSGSGKSTLLNLLGAVDRPTAGRVFIGPHETSAMRERELTALRRDAIGFVFQFFNLIPTINVGENVAFPLQLARRNRREIGERVASVLAAVGLEHRSRHFPHELSGGEMQRVAIARAIVHEPALILADEPTGNLDSRSGDRVLELLGEIHERLRPTVVMATHSERAASFGDYVVGVVDGRIATGDIPR